MDKIKSDRTDVGRNARELSRKIDLLRNAGDLTVGVAIPEADDCVLKIVRPTEQIAEFADFPTTIADNVIILTAKWLQQQMDQVTFVSNDINARIKANLIGLPAEDFRRGIDRGTSFYTGFLELELETDIAKIITPQKLEKLLADQHLYPNQFVVVWIDKQRERYRLFRQSPVERGIVEVRHARDMWTFKAKNLQQRMALELLADDNIQLVSLIGPAGTGKTFLTLLAGLHKVIVEKMYSRLFVARPLVSLGADIGFIPGDLQEKLFHWMHPIYDNLEFIFNEMKAKEEFFDLIDSYRTTMRKPRHGRPHNNNHRHRSSFIEEAIPSYNATVHDSVTMLQKRGILGLEAITYMRGRSIPRQFMFIDEAQNLSAQEIKTIISRAGEGTKVVLSGDPYQIDSPLLDFYSSGLTITAQKLKDQPLAATILLEESERSPLAKMAIKHL